MTGRRFARRRRAGGVPGTLLALVFVAWGLASAGAMAVDWMVDARATVTTGLLFLAGGLGMLSGRRTGERMAAAALTAQLVVTILSAGMAVAAVPDAASPPWYPLVAATLYAGASLRAILWLRRPAPLH